MSNSSFCTLLNPSPFKLTLTILFGKEEFYGFVNIYMSYTYSSMFWIMVLVSSSFSMKSNIINDVWLCSCNFSSMIVWLKGFFLKKKCYKTLRINTRYKFRGFIDFSFTIKKWNINNVVFVEVLLLLSLLWSWNYLVWRDDTSLMFCLLAI
jgi:hypothetical protein